LPGKQRTPSDLREDGGQEDDPSYAALRRDKRQKRPLAEWATTTASDRSAGIARTMSTV
jgi:hypothetical protein